MQRLVRIAKLFSDENRVKIVALLMKHGSLCVCELCDTLQLSQPLVSRHLKRMKAEGIITSRKCGKWMLYALAETRDDDACWFDTIRAHLSELPPLVVCNRYCRE